MEKWDARPFHPEANANAQGWNIVQLESRMYLRRQLQELIDQTLDGQLSTGDLQQQIHSCATRWGSRFSIHLVRTLQSEDTERREAVVWLLVQLNDPETVPLLHQMTRQTQLSRSIKLSAALALAGMGATAEMNAPYPCMRLYAISR